MALDFLIPVPDKVVAHNAVLPTQAIGNQIRTHTVNAGLPNLKGIQLAVFGVYESRNTFDKKTAHPDLNAIRIQFYKLMMGNWDATLADLGDITEGETVLDTYFAVKQATAFLLEQGIVSIIIGGTQDLTYPIYRSFEVLNKMVNIVSVDSRFDFGTQKEIVSSETYMSKIITEKPNILSNFSNLGYQSYFNAQEAKDLMDKLFFDAYRLGEVVQDLSMAEPILRNAHIVSLDLRAVKAAEMGGGGDFSPNGFDGREICTLARYAGLSEKVKAFGVFEGVNHPSASQLAAQIIWYFLEGYVLRQNEHPYETPKHFLKYTVPLAAQDLIFYKSLRSERWWVGVPFIDHTDNKAHSAALLPCTVSDYKDACAHKIPERWFKAQKKGFI